jgi:YVTN family beta-propeller protein
VRTHRTLLAAFAAVAVLAVVAACTSSSTGNPGAVAAAATPSVPAPAASPAVSVASTAAAGNQAATTGSSAASSSAAAASASPVSGAPAIATAPAAPSGPAAATTTMTLAKTITGHLDEKSVDASGHGLFFAQNMMYLHTINVYDESGKLLKIIPDTVNLSAMGYPQYPGLYKGAPVEAAFSPDGKYVYVSNYSMYGAAPLDREGSDECGPGNTYPISFVYRINIATLSIDKVIKVGSVPKFLAVSPDGQFLLVSNWCSYTESIIRLATGAQVQLKLGAYPRGIAIDPTSHTAYVAVMGSTRIAKISLANFAVSWIDNVGSAPRHLVMSPDGRYLYATINGSGVVDKIDLATRKVLYRVATGKAPRSMTISPDGTALYVVNYESNTMTKLRSSDMHILQTVHTNPDPIGITYDAASNRVWVACYSGSIMVFNDGPAAKPLS